MACAPHMRQAYGANHAESQPQPGQHPSPAAPPRAAERRVIVRAARSAGGRAPVRRGASSGFSACDCVEQLLALLVAKPAYPAVVVDAGLFHQGGGLCRAVSGHRPDDLSDLRLLRYVVMLGEHLRDRQLSGLYRGQQLTALLAGCLGLRERLGSLLRGQCRQSHVTPLVEWTNCPTDPARIAVSELVSGPRRDRKSV